MFNFYNDMVHVHLTGVGVPVVFGFEARRLSVSERDGGVEVCFGVQDDSAPLVSGLDATLVTADIGSAAGEPYYCIVCSCY